ncbi:MAG: hypothetical protein R3E97_05345 [Candidatus Eisenbacteria bacterium]
MMRHVRMLGVGLVMLGTLLAHPTPARSENTTQLGRWPTGPAASVAVDGFIVYSGAGAILRIADVTDGSSPSILSEYEFPSPVFDIVVADDKAYIATPHAGIFVLDVTDPSAPFEIGALPFATFLVDMDLSGTSLYLADGVGVHILDVSDPTVPTEVGQFTTPSSAQHVAVVDNLAFVADWGNGLLIYDVSIPTMPQLIGSQIPLVGLNEATVVRDGIAYVGDWQGLRIVNVSDPTNPTEIGFAAAGTLFDLEIAGDYVYAANGRGITVFDVSDPANPSQVWLVPGIHYGDIYYQIEIVGSRLYLADSIEGMRIFDLANPSHPTELGVVDARGFSYSTTVRGNLLYVSNGNRGMRVLDITDPSAPEEIGFLDTPWVAFATAVDDTHAFIADGLSGLHVVDITDPTLPVEVSDLSTTDWMYDVAVEGNIVVVANGNIGTGIIDVSDPSAPFLRSQFDSNDSCLPDSEPAYVQGVDIVGDLVYVAEEKCGLRILDISDPDNPVTVGTLNTPGRATKVVVEGDLAYIIDNPGLRIVDVSNPANPFQRGAVGIGNTDVAVADGYAYVTSPLHDVTVVDVGNPDAPVVVGSFETGFTAQGIDAAGSTAYAADGMDGVFVIRNDLAPADVLQDSGPTDGSLTDRLILGNSPNPFTESTRIRYALQEPSEVRLAVIDVAGRAVATGRFEDVPAGTHEITLDGMELPSGVYRYVLQAGSRRESGRMIHVR